MSTIFLFVMGFINFQIFGESEGMLSDIEMRKLGRTLCVALYGETAVKTMELNGFTWEK